MATQEGSARFPEAVVALGGWEQNVVYRLHPRTGRYIDLPSFQQVITQEMLSDMLVVFHAAGVESFVVIASGNTPTAISYASLPSPAATR